MPLTHDQKKKLVKFQEEATWQEKIDEVKKQLLDLDKVGLAERLKATRELKDAAEAEVKGLNVVVEAVSQLMEAILENEGVTSFRPASGVAAGYLFSVQIKARVVVTDKAAYHQWIREQGLTEFFDIHSSRTSSMANEALMAGEALPAGLQAYYQASMRMTAPSKKLGL